jgi:hypothetical protein
MTQPDFVSRRGVLRTSAVATTTLVLGGAGIGTVGGTTQDVETLLDGVAGGSPLLVARGEALGFDDESISGTEWMPDATIRGPEGVLAFAPRRLADENGRVGLENMLVMTGVRALEGDLTTRMAGGVFEGGRWFPQDTYQRLGEIEWFPTDIFVSEDGVEGGRVMAFRDEEWEPNNGLFPEEWFPQDTYEPTDVVEAGTAEFETADVWPLFGAAGHNFFPDDVFERVQDDLVPWEELADAETATVLEL